MTQKVKMYVFLNSEGFIIFTLQIFILLSQANKAYVDILCLCVLPS